MKAVEYLKNRNRLCRIGCDECPLSFSNNETKKPCRDFERRYPEKTVEKIKEWVKENPVKTYLSVFLEKFPNASLSETDGTPVAICPGDLYGVEKWDGCGKSEDDCYRCWNREYKEDL